MNQYCFLNGKILLLSEAKIGIGDIGLLRGYGVYDGLAVFNGKIFHLADHWKRLLSGARILNLKVPITKEKAGKIIEELAVKNKFIKRANVRIILTGGQTLGGIEYNFENPTFYILVEKWESLLQDFYKNGAKLVTYRHMRELPEYKTTNYIKAVSLQNWRKEKQAVEILYTHDGKVLECATSNVFIVRNKTVITPNENILKGITRKVILEIAGDKYKIEERPVREEELKTADEVFITSSFKDIVPIVKVDDFVIANGQVGPITRDLMEEFAKIINIG